MQTDLNPSGVTASDSPTGGAGTLLAFHPAARGTHGGGGTKHIGESGDGEGERDGHTFSVSITESARAHFSLVYAASARAYTLVTGNHREGHAEFIIFAADLQIQIKTIDAFRAADASLFLTDDAERGLVWNADRTVFAYTELPNGYRTLAPITASNARGISILATPFPIVLF